MNEILHEEDSEKTKYMLQAVSKFQFHMVARVDDDAHFKEGDYVSNLLFHDAKVAATLCVGGPCKYELVEGGGELVLG